MVETKAKVRLVNRMRGEVAVTIGGASHVLRYPIGALREIKDYFKLKDISELDGDALDPVEKTLICLLAGLRRGSMPEATIEWLDDNLMVHEMGPVGTAMNAAMNAGAYGASGKPPKAAVEEPHDPEVKPAPLPTSGS